MYVGGDQQQDGDVFTSTDLYSAVLKAGEARSNSSRVCLQNVCNQHKSIISLMGYGQWQGIYQTTWLVARDYSSTGSGSGGHVLQLLKSIYGTKHAARRGISTFWDGWRQMDTLQSKVKRQFSWSVWAMILSSMACLLMTWYIFQPIRRWSKNSQRNMIQRILTSLAVTWWKHLDMQVNNGM